MDFIEYLFKVNIAIVLFYIFYRLLFQYDTFFKLKRVVLLSILFMVVVYPLITLAKEVVQNYQSMVMVIPADIVTLTLPEVVITPGENDRLIESVFNTGIIVYITILCCVLSYVVFQIYQIVRKINQSDPDELLGIEVWVLKNTALPFSFFNWIVLDPDMHKDKELNEILLHEDTHAKQWHTIDVILCEAICILCWFNPFVWLLKREMRMNLEFLADKSVLSSGCNAEHYQLHLLRLSYPKAAAISNNFNFSPLKKRIRMMNKQKTHWIGLSKYLLIMPLFALLLLVNNLQAIANENDPATNENIVVSTLKQIVPEAPVIEKNAPVQSKDDPKTKQTPSGTVYTHVEVPPEFPGGEAAMMLFLKNNIKYPVTAYEQGIQGTVSLRFVVTNTGKIGDVEVVRSLSPECDKEAIRVIKSMPDWVPGKQKGEAVNVFFNMPIRFKLSGKNTPKTK